MRTKRLLSRAATYAALSLLLAAPAVAASGAPAATAVPAAVQAVQPAAQAASATYTASSQLAEYPASNVGDGNQATYWESTNNQFPQWIQADLGATTNLAQVVLKLPAGWEARTETLTVQGSTNGTSFSTLVASAGYRFDPATANTVTITVTGSTRYVRLNVTANTGWPAAQLSEFEVHGPAGGDTQPPSAPGNLAYTQPASGQIRLTWSASTDNTGVAGYDVYANNQLRGSVGGTVLTYTDSQPDGTTVSYYVRAKDAAGNQSGEQQHRDPQRDPGRHEPGAGQADHGVLDGVHLRRGQRQRQLDQHLLGGRRRDVPEPADRRARLQRRPRTRSSSSSTPTPRGARAPRRSRSKAVTRLRARSPRCPPRRPTASTRRTGNTVTIPLSGRAADVRLRVTANSGAGGGQAAEFQVFGVPAPNPDLTISGVSWSPQNPVETDTITASATVRNAGTAASGATNVNLYLGTTKVGTAAVGALAAGASATVSANIGTRDAGSYQLTAKVDEANAVIEQNEANNSYTGSTALVVSPVQSSDLVAATGVVAEQPVRGQHGDVLHDPAQPGHDRVRVAAPTVSP